jgi:hypothetical protein
MKSANLFGAGLMLGLAICEAKEGRWFPFAVALAVCAVCLAVAVLA